MASTLKRDADEIKKYVKETSSGGLFTTVPCKIQVPSRYFDIGLGEIGIDTYVWGIFAIVLENGTYAVSNACALMKIEPFKTLEVKIGDESYHEFYFNANSTITYTTNLIRRDVLMYNLINEFFFQGKVPWFFNDIDLINIRKTVKKHANSNLAENYEIFELLVSAITRYEKDKRIYYRQVLKDNPQAKYSFIPLKSVYYAASNTLNKLAGAYFSQGVASALVNPTQNVEHVEKLLRA